MKPYKHEHGPVAMTRCFYCGEVKDEILFDTRLRDLGHIHQQVIDYQPCTACAEWMRKGIIMLEVKDGESGDTPFRTGRMFVLTDDGMRRIYKPGPALDEILVKRMAYIHESLAEFIGLHAAAERRKQEQEGGAS